MLAWPMFRMTPDGPMLVPPPDSYRDLRPFLPNYVAYLEDAERRGIWD
jgi:hypothetical protein